MVCIHITHDFVAQVHDVQWTVVWLSILTFACWAVYIGFEASKFSQSPYTISFEQKVQQYACVS
jgi:hypothetical protein